MKTLIISDPNNHPSQKLTNLLKNKYNMIKPEIIYKFT